MHKFPYWLTSFAPSFLFEADKGGGEQGKTPTGDELDSKLDDDNKKASGDDKGGEDKTFSAEYVKELRAEAAKYRTQLRNQNAEKVKADAEAEKAKQKELESQGEWQKLAEQRAAEIEQLTAVKTAHDAMLVSIGESNAKRIEQLPETLRPMVPDFDDPQKVAAYLDEHWDKLTASAKAPSLDGGAGGGGRGNGKVTTADTVSNVIGKRYALPTK